MGRGVPDSRPTPWRCYKYQPSAIATDDSSRSAPLLTVKSDGSVDILDLQLAERTLRGEFDPLQGSLASVNRPRQTAAPDHVADAVYDSDTWASGKWYSWEEKRVEHFSPAKRPPKKKRLARARQVAAHATVSVFPAAKFDLDTGWDKQNAVCDSPCLASGSSTTSAHGSDTSSSLSDAANMNHGWGKSNFRHLVQPSSSSYHY